MKKALILDDQNKVINAVVVNPDAIPPHLASALIRDMDAPEGIGWSYDAQSDEFTAPPQPEPEPIDWGTQKLSRFEFLKAFTVAERITIKAANDPIINDALDMFREAGAVVLSYPDTQQFIGYLAQQGLITPERMTEILSGSWVEAVRAEIL